MFMYLIYNHYNINSTTYQVKHQHVFGLLYTHMHNHTHGRSHFLSSSAENPGKAQTLEYRNIYLTNDNNLYLNGKLE